MQIQNSGIFESPRILSLREELESGNGEALNLFWDQVAKEGAPLLEPIPDDDNHALVTFLWRADKTVDHVVFYSELLRGMWWDRWSDALMDRLLETNLFYRTYRVRKDLRFVYWLSPDHPLVHPREVKDWDEYMAHCRVDPLNPNVFVQDRDRSFVEMPDAAPQKWHIPQADTPHGQVERFPWHSKLLNNDRQVWVYTSHGYSVDREPYPVVLLFDGDVFTRDVDAPTILDNLIAAGEIPPVVVVMLDSPDRSLELYCHEPFATFIAREIIPWARTKYHISTKPDQTTVAGASAGGLAAAFMGLRHSEIFGNVLSNSGAFGWSLEQRQGYPWHWDIPPEAAWLIRQYATHEKLPLRFHLDAGLLEDQRDNQVMTILQSNRYMRDVLLAKGYSMHYSEFCGGHQYINFRATLPAGLIALLGRKAD